MRYYDEEVGKKLILLDIKNRKKVLELIPEIEEVILNFDKKVLNIRVEKALKRVADYLYVYINNNYIDIYILMINDDHIQVKSSLSDCLKTYYTDNERITILNGSIEKFTTEGKRINAAAMIGCIEKYKESFEKDIEEWISSLEKVEEYKREIEELKERFEKLSNEIPYQIKEYFNLNYIFENK